jgi:hypothetical protein
MYYKVDTLGFEPRALRMRSGCDAITPCAHLLKGSGPAQPLAEHCIDGGRGLEDPMPYNMKDISPGRHLQRSKKPSPSIWRAGLHDL